MKWNSVSCKGARGPALEKSAERKINGSRKKTLMTKKWLITFWRYHFWFVSKRFSLRSQIILSPIFPDGKRTQKTDKWPHTGTIFYDILRSHSRCKAKGRQATTEVPFDESLFSNGESRSHEKIIKYYWVESSAPNTSMAIIAHIGLVSVKMSNENLQIMAQEILC